MRAELTRRAGKDIFACMGKQVQFSEEAYETLRRRAEAKGLSISEYVERLANSDRPKPDIESIRARLATMPVVSFAASSAELIREDRDAR